MKIFITLVFAFNLIACYGQFTETSNPQGLIAGYGTTGFMGGGITFCDFDGDGLDDICVGTDPSQPARFYKNTGTGFSELVGFLPDSSEIKSINWVDTDNDGDQDLFITRFGKSPRFFENTGNLTLVDITDYSGIGDSSMNWPFWGASWGDINNDGLLEVFISNRASAGPNTNLLYLNLGNNKFLDITAAAGVADSNDLSFCSAWIDYDRDGFQDLYIANDKLAPNKLYRNNGDSTFTDVSAVSGAGIVIDAMSTTIGDYNNDSWLDIYITNTPGGNVLLHNNGDGTFQSVADSLGVGFYGIGWGASFLDADNDTDQDLYVSGMTNGSGGELPSAFYNRTGIDTFEVISSGFEMDTVPSFGNTIGDINNDGFPDIVVNNNMPNIFLFENTPNSNNWLKVTLEGTISNMNGVGSYIMINANNQNQWNYTLIGESLCSQSSFSEFFGIGNAAQADTLIVEWLSGHHDTLFNINPNQTLHVVEGMTQAFDTSIIASSFSACQGQSITLTCNSPDFVNWSNGQTANPLIITQGGTYYANLENEFGFTENSQSIQVNFTPLPAANPNVVDISCFGDSDGAITLFPQTSNGTSSIVWYDGQNGNSKNNLGPGWYSYTITDGLSCELIDSVEIIEPSPLSSTTGMFPETNSSGDGKAWVSVSGGTPPYQYFWNDQMAQTGDTAVALSGGNYIVWVLDQNSCSDSASVTVSNTLGLSHNGINMVHIYPNPSNGLFKFDLNHEQDGNVNYEIYNVQGKLLNNGTLEELKRRYFDLTEFEPGIYTLKLKILNTGGQQAFRLIKM